MNIFKKLIISSMILVASIVAAINYYNSSQDSFEVVVARYNEDLSWIEKAFVNIKVTIYNKGKDDLTLPSHYKVIKLKNIGRESDTYLRHIILNYANLAEKTLFLQGNPYDHPTYLPLMKYFDTIISRTLFLQNDPYQHPLHLSLLSKKVNKSSCKNIIAPCIKQDLYNLSYFLSELFLSDAWQKKYGNSKLRAYAKENDNLVNYLNEDLNLFLMDKQDINWIPGAQFAISKDKILNHSIEYYKYILKTIDNIEPREGHYIERLWDVIFNGKSN